MARSGSVKRRIARLLVFAGNQPETRSIWAGALSEQWRMTDTAIGESPILEICNASKHTTTPARTKDV